MDKLYPSDPSYDGPPTTVPDLTLGERLERIEEHLGLAPQPVGPEADPYPEGAAEANPEADASLIPEPQPVDETGDLIPTPAEPDPEVAL